MKIDDTDFKKGFIEGFATEAEFLEEMDQEGYYHIFQGSKRRDQLKKAYALHHPKKKPEKLSNNSEVSTK